MGLEQGIVAVPLRTSSPVVTSFIANSISLTPGTLTVDVRPRRFGIDEGHHQQPPTLYVHTLIVGDPEHVRREARRLEELAVAAFGTPVDRAAVFGGAAAVGEPAAVGDAAVGEHGPAADPAGDDAARPDEGEERR